MIELKYSCKYCNNTLFRRFSNFDEKNASEEGSYIYCDCGKKLCWNKMSISDYKKPCSSVNILPVIHEYFDESLGRIVKGRSDIQNECRRNNRMYISRGDAESGMEMQEKKRDFERMNRINEKSVEVLKALRH